MKKQYANKARAAVLAGILSLTLAGCGEATTTAQTTATSSEAANTTEVVTTTLVDAQVDGMLDTSDLFTQRDLEQTADTTDAQSIVVADGQDVAITEEGVYVLSGTATNATITVDVDSSQKVQLVLDGLTITNDDFPAIYVVSADKVFVTTVQGTNNVLSVTDAFVSDGDTNTDAVIFSRDDLVLNGLGTLAISSSNNAISSHDDLKVTGGTYAITSVGDALEASDNVLIADGTFAIDSAKDAIHAENDEDDTTGNIYIVGGTFDITAGDDGIQGTAVVQIDGGTFTIDALEAIESTYVQVNGGDVSITSSDDGINASYKSSAFTPTIEITGATINISMAAGDTDALDSNGNLIIRGGTVNITAQFAFDYDGTAEFTGGTVYVNGEQVTTIENSMMMGGPGGMGGQPGMGGPGGMGGQPGMGVR